jgi:hypothetical protein
MARGYMIEDPASFASVLDQEERGEFVIRRRRMKDGSEVWADVQTHPHPIARAFLENIREAGIVQMADRIRAVWNPKVIFLATDGAVDLGVDDLVSRRVMMSGSETAAGIMADVRAKGWAVRAQVVSGSDFPNRILLGDSPPLTTYAAVVPTANGWGTSRTLWTTLPAAEAFRLAAVEFPGIRPATPEGGILAECMRRHGIVPSWTDIQKLMPEYLPDDRALKAAKDAERGEMRRLRDTLPSVRYRVPGRRGGPFEAIYDPSRVSDPGRTLVQLLGENVQVEVPQVLEPAPQPTPLAVSHKRATELRKQFLVASTGERRPNPRQDGRRTMQRPLAYQGFRQGYEPRRDIIGRRSGYARAA